MQGSGSLLIYDFDISVSGVGSLLISDFDIIFTGTGSITFGPEDVQTSSITFSGVSNFVPSATTDYGRAFIPSFSGQGGEGAYGFGTGYLPALVGSGQSSLYVPSVPEYGFGYLPSLYGGGVTTTSSGSTANVEFPSFVGQGGEGDYGYGGGTFTAFVGIGFDDLFPGVAPINANIYMQSGIIALTDHIVFINNTGQIIDTITASRELVAQIIGELTATGSFSIIGEFLTAIEESLLSSASIAGIYTSKITFESDSRVWVINMDTGASSQYDDYGFNSFFERDGKYYGVAEDGVYLLEGDDDEGVEIDALVEFGRSNFGSPHKKKVINVYAGVSSTGKMLLKVDADGTIYTYEARSSSGSIENNRFDIGKGLKGNYYNFTLINRNGNDFDLETITFEPVVLRRKI
jgi:hypothetical protein